MNPFDRFWYRTGHRLERRLWKYLTPEARARHYVLQFAMLQEATGRAAAAMRGFGITVAEATERMVAFGRQFADTSTRVPGRPE